MVVNHYVGSGKWIPVLCKNKCSQLQNPPSILNFISYSLLASRGCQYYSSLIFILQCIILVSQTFTFNRWFFSPFHVSETLLFSSVSCFPFFYFCFLSTSTWVLQFTFHTLLFFLNFLWVHDNPKLVWQHWHTKFPSIFFFWLSYLESILCLPLHLLCFHAYECM